MDDFSGTTEQILRRLRELSLHMTDEDYDNDMFVSTTESLRTTMREKTLAHHEHKYVSGTADEIQTMMETLDWTRVNIPVDALLSVDYLKALATLNLHDRFTDCLVLNGAATPDAFAAFANPHDAMCFRLAYDTSKFSQ